MIDYHTCHQIHHRHRDEKLSPNQIAAHLGLHPDTVSKWLAIPRYKPRQGRPRTRKLAPLKKQIAQWLEPHPYTAQQLYQKLQPLGYQGAYTILKEHVRKIRPPKTKHNDHLKLLFAPRRRRPSRLGRMR